MKKLIIDIIEVYIPNAWFRIKCFFDPNILKEVKEFDENFKRSLNTFSSEKERYAWLLKLEYKWIEDKIRLLLVMQGYDRDRISFRGDSRRYIVYKYWEPINDHSLEYISSHTNVKLNVEEIYDDDCGFLYSYNILK